MKENLIPIEVKNFIDRILLIKYRNSNYVNSRG